MPDDTRDDCAVRQEHWDHFTEMFREETVKQDFIACLQSGQVGVLARRIRQAVILNVREFYLGSERVDFGQVPALGCLLKLREDLVKVGVGAEA